MKSEVTLWYFADPMCSWCWGFSPVLEEIKKTYGKELKIALMLGGLRPGTTDPITPESREEILHHWKAVHNMTGQEFNFNNPMPDGFIYDTELPSRAVMAISELKPEFTLPFFKEVQEAFYVEQKDVTDSTVLSGIASGFKIDPQEFLEHYDSDSVREKVLSHFQHTRQAEVRGFPTLVISSGKSFRMLAHGYRSYDDIRQEIESWLNENLTNESSE